MRGNSSAFLIPMIEQLEEVLIKGVVFDVKFRGSMEKR